MGLVSQVSNRVYGLVSPTLQRLVSSDIDGLVSRMLDEAAAAWAEANWIRFDDREANCTIQLYRWCLYVGRKHPELRILTVQLEWSNPTIAMLQALESAEGPSRPDLRIQIGERAGRSLECKRLSPAQRRPWRYVHEGLDRFVSGTYGGDEPTGVMVGYIQGGTAEGLITAINVEIVAHPRMGPSHQLQRIAPSGLPIRCHSSHLRSNASSIDIEHFLVDLQV